MSRCYDLLVIDRSNKVVCKLPIGRRALIVSSCVAILLPLLIGLGAKLSVNAELAHLRTMHRFLEQENASYRSEIRAFTDQVQSLDGVIDELQLNGGHGRATARTIDTLDRVKAAGGEAFPSFSSPPDALDVLRSALQVLSDRLPSMARDVERREALAAAAPSIWPAQGWLTDRFGMRTDPLTGRPDFHPGLDISTPSGEPVYATGAGVVEVASYSGDFGNLVELRHDFGLSTRYAHLSRFAVVPGAPVKRGDVIGYVGSTGRATGSHVHYEILVNGTSIDPLRILSAP